MGYPACGGVRTRLKVVLPEVVCVVDKASFRHAVRHRFTNGESLTLGTPQAPTRGGDVGLTCDEREAEQMLAAFELAEGIGVGRLANGLLDPLEITVEYFEQFTQQADGSSPFSCVEVT
jgi:hypothetical protein